MKKILIMLLCLLLTCSGALAEGKETQKNAALQAPGEKLGLDLMSMLYAPGENLVLSPQSLTLALGMAAEGAQGETLSALLEALGVQELSQIVAQMPEALKSANALFVKPGLELETDVLDRLLENYGAQQFVLDGDVVEKVNAWVYEHTDELIENMFTQAPKADVGMVLLNAVAMDATWASPFDCAANTMQDFHTLNAGDVQVEMMHQSERFEYVEKDGVQAVRLPYVEGNLEMWVAMPAQGDMANLLENLTAQDGLDYLRGDAREREVVLSLPKFDVSCESTLSDALKLLGLENVFSTEADFSGLSDIPLCLDEVLQKSRVQVDEDGTKAAAATAVSTKSMALLDPEPPVEMNVDRPFAFLIVDGQSDAICFAGVIENPTLA